MGKRPKEEYQLYFTVRRPIQKRPSVLQEPKRFFRYFWQKKSAESFQDCFISGLSIEMKEGRLLFRFLNFFSFLWFFCKKIKKKKIKKKKKTKPTNNEGMLESNHRTTALKLSGDLPLPGHLGLGSASMNPFRWNRVYLLPDRKVCTSLFSLNDPNCNSFFFT